MLTPPHKPNECARGRRYPAPRDKAVYARLVEAVRLILMRPSQPPSARGRAQHANAVNAMFFDAVHLLVHYDAEPDLQILATTQLGNHLVVRWCLLLFGCGGVGCFGVFFLYIFFTHSLCSYSCVCSRKSRTCGFWPSRG
jgi:hypothetical protein